MIGLALRGFFLIGIISWYSSGVFKLINDYFRSEYKNYLSNEFKKNKYLVPSAEIPVQLEKDNLAAEETKPKVIFDLPTFIKEFSSPAPQCIATKTKNLINNENNQNNNDIDEDYWLNRKRNNDGKIEAYCQVDGNVKCKDN